MIQKIQYDIDIYPLDDIVAEVFNVYHLDQLHTMVDYDLFKPGYDQHTIFHKKYYEQCDESHHFHLFYKKLLSDLILKKFNDEDVYIQRIPTLRIQFPNNVGVATWHRDRDFNHQREEINVFLPLTPAYGTNTIWTESEEGKKDYQPLEANVGDCYIWDGANLYHGNKENQTGKTRVSVDFRIIKKSDFKETGLKTVSAGRELKVGDYWMSL